MSSPPKAVHLLQNMQPRCGRKSRSRTICVRDPARVTCRFCLRLIGGTKPPTAQGRAA